MFVDITYNPTGESLMLRRLAPNERLDPVYHADRYFRAVGLERSKCTGYVPVGDYRCEIRSTKRPTGSCWTAAELFADPAE